MLNGLDLFSGIGGLTLALSQWVRPIAYCENDRFCQGILLSRGVRGDLPQAPIWDDVRTLRAEHLPSIDILYGGFPCQDISSAGLRKGLGGERSSLFFEVVRLTKELGPTFVFLENVAAIKKFVPQIRTEFERLSYDCRDGFLSAANVGAPHIRERWFFLAHANSDRRRLQSKYKQQKQTGKFNNSCQATNWTNIKPPICGMVHGVRGRVDQIRALGNSVVPLQAKEAFKKLMGI